jgi:ElaB/YqjD/DUF883 family membrane-anchored ribosome-binding protein
VEAVKRTAGDVQQRAEEAYEQAGEWAHDTYERASSWASDTLGQGSRRLRSRTGQLGSAGQGIQRYVTQNPVMVGLVGLAAGLLLGSLLPRTRREDEMFGEWADEVRHQGLRYAQDAAQRGREFVEDSFVGDDPRFERHDSEFRSGEGMNRH